jgi:phage terminase large subunit-like protein
MRTSVRFTVVVEQEPGSGGKESAEATIRNLAGHICIADKPGAGRSKELRAEPFAAQVQGGKRLASRWTMGGRFRRGMR